MFSPCWWTRDMSSANISSNNLQFLISCTLCQIFLKYSGVPRGLFFLLLGQVLNLISIPILTDVYCHVLWSVLEYYLTLLMLMSYNQPQSSAYGSDSVDVLTSRIEVDSSLFQSTWKSIWFSSFCCLSCWLLSLLPSSPHFSNLSFFSDLR